MNQFLKSLALLFVALFSTVLVNAADPLPPPNSTTQKWFCLKPERIGVHESRLTVKDGVTYDITKPTYVVVKIAFDIGDTNPSADNSAMSTGETTLDTYVFNSTDGFNKLVEKLGFSGGVSQGSNPTNSFPIEWADDLSKTSGGDEERSHFWYGMQEADPVPTTTLVQGDVGAQQQGTFDWVKSRSEGAADCEFLSWDPFGYVFDAETHGPIGGVYVRLLTSKTANGIYAPVPVGIGVGKVPANPVVTNSDGSYKFYVDPGFYKLELMGDVVKSSQKYTIEKDISKIKLGFSDFGYEQIYIAETPEVIQEVAGKVERRDIAIETIGAPAPFSINGAKLKEIMMHTSLQDGEQMVRLSGRALFIPVDLVALYKDSNNIIIEEKTFSLVPGHKYIPLNTTNERNFDIWVSANSTDGKGILNELRVDSKYSTKSQSISIPPMPSYLDGIALGRNSVPIIRGTVAIYPIGSNKPFHSTKTDGVGHFVITSEWIPSFPYELRYTTTTGDEIVITTTEYLKQNATYHKENNTQSFSAVITDSEGNPKKANPNPSIIQSEPTTIQEKGITSGTQGVMMLIVAIMMLVMIGAGAFIVMKSKQP